MKLGLGTVQFGLDYGVSNTEGKTALVEVVAILKHAAISGIRIIDTASLYGSSEAVLGQIFSSMGCPFDVITKTPYFGTACLTAADVMRLEQVFHQSLSNLQIPSVYGLLFHHADDLLADGASLLVDRVCEFKRQGLIKKWGFSAYTGQQVDGVLNRFNPDLVQVPINVFDQRIVSGGQLRRLKQARVEVHSRSVFLQGLLLMEQASLNPYFAPYREMLESFSREAKASGFTNLQASLKYVVDIKEIDHVIVGVCSNRELKQIIGVLQEVPAGSLCYKRFSSHDERLLNPAIWKLR